jgi:hypothetical protein
MVGEGLSRPDRPQTRRRRQKAVRRLIGSQSHGAIIALPFDRMVDPELRELGPKSQSPPEDHIEPRKPAHNDPRRGRADEVIE